MKKMRCSISFCLLTFLLLISGCPRMRSCVDIIIPPGCVVVGTRLNARCCHMGAIYECDLYIYRDSHGVSGYRQPMFGITGCPGPLGRCRQRGPYTCM